jgi:hypothetical protein
LIASLKRVLASEENRWKNQLISMSQMEKASNGLRKKAISTGKNQLLPRQAISFQLLLK